MRSFGRFLSPDWSAKVEPVPYAKLDNPQTLNLYLYADDNPESVFDPDGHCFEDACVGEATAVAITGAVIFTMETIRYYQQNPDASAAVAAGAQAAGQTVSNAVSSIASFFKKTVKQKKAEEAGRRCTYCGKPTKKAQKSQKGVTPPGDQGETDHYNPKSKGGSEDKSNAVHACRDCNQEKSDTLPSGTKWELPGHEPQPHAVTPPEVPCKVAKSC